MFANLDYYSAAFIAFLAAIVAVFCGAIALHGWGTVLFTTPDFWQSVQIAGNQHASDWLAIEVYLCPWGALICGWLASRWFR